MLRQKRKQNIHGSSSISRDINSSISSDGEPICGKSLKGNEYSSTTDSLEDFLFGSSAYDVSLTWKSNLRNDQDLPPSENDQVSALWSDDDDDDTADLIMEKSKFKSSKETRSVEFTKIMGPTPLWAKPSDETDSRDSFLDGHLLQTKTKVLPKDDLDYTSCSLLNANCFSSRKIESFEFHKTATIALTASHDCRLNLFQVDGKNNSKLHSLFLEQFPINCAHFLSSGTEVLMSSHVRWMYSYDMVSGTISRVPFIKGAKDGKILNFKVSPDQQHIVFLSRSVTTTY